MLFLLLAPLTTYAMDAPATLLERSTSGIVPGNPVKKQQRKGCLGGVVCWFKGRKTRSSVSVRDNDGRGNVFATSEPNCEVREVKDIAVAKYGADGVPLNREQVNLIDTTVPRVLTDDERVDDRHQLVMARDKKETATFMMGALTSKIAEEQARKRAIKRGSTTACVGGAAGIGVGCFVVTNAVFNAPGFVAGVVGLFAGHVVSKVSGTVAGTNLAANVVRYNAADSRQQDYESQLALYQADNREESDKARAEAQAAEQAALARSVAAPPQPRLHRTASGRVDGKPTLLAGQAGQA